MRKAKPSPYSPVEALKTQLDYLRNKKIELQGKPFKSQDEKLMLAAVDIRIGMALLDLEALGE